MGDTRNDALEFARRTRRNLFYIEQAARQGANVHVVTQLTVSLLGLVVFPKEKLLLKQAEQLTTQEMREDGWPNWTIIIDDPAKPTLNLGVLLRKLRNAICHARVAYDSDSRNLDDVTLTVEDRKDQDSAPRWVASIAAKDLHTFWPSFHRLHRAGNWLKPIYAWVALLLGGRTQYAGRSSVINTANGEGPPSPLRYVQNPSVGDAKQAIESSELIQNEILIPSL